MASLVGTKVEQNNYPSSDARCTSPTNPNCNSSASNMEVIEIGFEGEQPNQLEDSVSNLPVMDEEGEEEEEFPNEPG
ncbi:unnamed protein product [Mesocestoides corti]|uniref:CTNNB1 binding N-teminal domain-containing protein n=1 Tax=Mesocestoides corti TaxID=53468 RepID=A0A0R3UBR3_MESCO|nr:unnamed protein product [Mesocestoides corti]